MGGRMTATGVTRAIMEKKGYTNASLGKSIGVDNKAIWDRLKKEDMKVSTLVQMLASMGYKLAAMPSEQRMKAEWYELK